MEDIASSLILKRAVNIKAIATPRWKEEVEQEFQRQISQLDSQIQQLEMQAKRAIAELQKQSLTIPPDQLAQQTQNIQGQVNQKKNEFLQQKNNLLKQLEQVQQVEFGQEVGQGQIESFCRIEKGDNLIQKLRVEIVIRDGVVEEIRGEI